MNRTSSEIEMKIACLIFASALLTSGCVNDSRETACLDADLPRAFERTIAEEEYKNPTMLRHEGMDWFTDENGMVQIVQTYRVLQAFEANPRPGDILVCRWHYDGKMEDLFKKRSCRGDGGVYFCSFNDELINFRITNCVPVAASSVQDASIQLPKRICYVTDDGIVPLPGYGYWALSEDFPEEMYLEAFERVRKRHSRGAEPDPER